MLIHEKWLHQYFGKKSTLFNRVQKQFPELLPFSSELLKLPSLQPLLTLIPFDNSSQLLDYSYASLVMSGFIQKILPSHTIPFHIHEVISVIIDDPKFNPIKTHILAEFDRLILEDKDKNIKFGDGDLFSNFLLEFGSTSIQNEYGVVYTPDNVCRFLIREQLQYLNYNPISSPFPAFIDPTCGTGRFLYNFLLEIKEIADHTSTKINVSSFIGQNLHFIHGNDKNPLSLIATMGNLIKTCINLNIQLHQFVFDDQLHLVDLFDVEIYPQRFLTVFRKEKFDLVMGNLPWNVINNIHAPTLKSQLECIAKKYNIYMTWKNRSNLEMATVIFKIIQNSVVVKGGRIGFLLPSSLLTATQHSKFRRFVGLKNISVYRFNQDIFPIHALALFGTYQPNRNSNIKKYQEQTITSVYCNISDNFAEVNIDKYTKLAPTHVSFHRGKPLVGKYCPIDPDKHFLPIKKSPYFSKVYRGPDITPRQLLFVEVIDDLPKDNTQENSSLVTISPIQKHTQSTQSGKWNFVPYTKSQINRENLFSVIKSTDIVPFLVLYKHLAFLPITLRENHYHFQQDTQMKKYSRNHYYLLEKIYKEHQKSSATNQSLKDSLTYGKKLFNPALIKPIKVVYPVGGSYSKAAIVHNPELIIDVTFYYLTPKTLDEAYYLTAWLNSPLLHKNLPRVCTVGANGSIRVIHMAPWMFPLPNYNPNHRIHQKIVQIAKDLEKRVHHLYYNDKISSHDIKKPIYSEKRAPFRKAYKILEKDERIQQFQASLDTYFQEIINTHSNPF